MPLYEQTKATTIICQGEPFQRYISEERIQRRLQMIGTVIDEEYRDCKPILIGVLNGAFMVLADLMRALSIDCEIDFLKLSSYGARKVSSGDVRQLKRIDANLSGRNVIIVEDIVDTGLSMQYLLDRIGEHDPQSVRTFTLLHKAAAVEHEVSLDYVGFEIPDRFVIGYGMDYGQIGRNLADIYIRVSSENGHVPDAVEPSL